MTAQSLAADMLKATFTRSPMAISLTRQSDGLLVDVNHRWCLLMGFTQDEVIGRNSVELGIWVDKAARDRAITTMFTAGNGPWGQPPFIVTPFIRSDGRVMQLQMQGSILAIGGVAHAVIYTTDITDSFEAQQALAASEQRLQQLNDELASQMELYVMTERLARVGHWTVRPHEALPRWSKGLIDLTGMDAEQVGSFAQARSGIDPDDMPHFLAARAHMDGEIVEYRWHHPNEGVHWMRSRMRRHYRVDGSYVDLGVVQDFTQERQARLALQEQLSTLQLLTSRLPEMVFQFVMHAPGRGRFVFVSDAVQSIFGVSAEDVRTDVKRFFSCIHQDDIEALSESMRANAYDGRNWSHEFRVQGADGRVRNVYGQAITVLEPHGQLVAYGSVSDITARKLAEEKIERLAFYDVLTGLPNRRMLMDRLQRALASSVREAHFGALLFIDLDNFKDLNDTQGHDVGDLLLQEVAQRLRACVRETDTVARLGGDEFVVMLHSLGPESALAIAQAEHVGKKVMLSLNQIYVLGGLDHHSSPSIGVTLFEGQKQTVDELLKQADLAMYEAKAAGRNALRFFDPLMQSMVAQRTAMEIDLRAAIQRQELVLHYQPVVDEVGQVVGFEALVRWLHPQQGLVSPNAFIALAEQTGLILPLGEWVLEAACRQLAMWARSDTTAGLSIAVNVSARQFKHPGFVPRVQALMQRTAVDPQRLTLELTESMLLSDAHEAVQKMTDLRAMGVKFSLDDFGTGYSSLTYLKLLPLEYLKIDQSFVRDVLSDPNDAAIARTVLALGASLGLRVVAEGVETQGQREFLLSNGCRLFQGYLFGKPTPIGNLALDGPGPTA